MFSILLLFIVGTLSIPQRPNLSESYQLTLTTGLGTAFSETSVAGSNQEISANKINFPSVPENNENSYQLTNFTFTFLASQELCNKKNTPNNSGRRWNWIQNTVYNGTVVKTTPNGVKVEVDVWNTPAGVSAGYQGLAVLTVDPNFPYEFYSMSGNKTLVATVMNWMPIAPPPSFFQLPAPCLSASVQIK
jgi:hypothetical protein